MQFSRYCLRKKISNTSSLPLFFVVLNTLDRVPFVDSVISNNFFSVPWEKDNMTFAEIYPTLNNTCGNGVCAITDDNNCLCSLTLSETPAFDSLPSRKDVQTKSKSKKPENDNNTNTSGGLSLAALAEHFAKMETSASDPSQYGPASQEFVSGKSLGYRYVTGVSSSLGNRSIAASYRYRSWQL